MKAYGGVDVQIHVFLTTALVEDECSASRPGRFTSEKREPGTHWLGGWVGPKAGEVKILLPLYSVDVFPMRQDLLSESASELYRRLSAKLVPTFADRGCNVISVTDP
jgi:hypothetical protein